MHRIYDLPIVTWLPAYNRATLLSDLLAGLSVGVLLIPQSLAYAVLAGLPPVYGLYTSTLPLFIYATLASSTKVQPGPVGPTAILINSALNAVVTNVVEEDPATGEDVPSAEYINTAVALSFIVGVVQMLLGFFRFGFIANLLSWPVMSGYTSAAAFIIIASQLKDLLGLDAASASGFVERLGAAFSALPTAHWQTALLGVLATTLLMTYKMVPLPGGRKVPAWFPMQLLVVLLCLGLSAGLDWESTGMPVVGQVPSDIPTPAFPLNSAEQFVRLLPGAIVLAVVSYVGSISLAVVFGKDVGEEVDANMELVAAGAACFGGSFFRSFVISGSFTRTAVNADLGAKTPMAVVFTGCLMVLCLLLLAPLFSPLPKTVLAAMITASAKSLVKLADARLLYRSSPLDFMQMAATFILTLALGIDNGIIAAVGLSLLLLLYRSFQPRVSELGRFPGTDVFIDLSRFPDAVKVRGLHVLRVDGELHFGNIKLLTNHLRALHTRALKVRRAAGLPPHGLEPPPPDAASVGSAPSTASGEGLDVELAGEGGREEDMAGAASTAPASSIRRRGAGSDSEAGASTPAGAASVAEPGSARTSPKAAAAVDTGEEAVLILGAPFGGVPGQEEGGGAAAPLRASSPPVTAAKSRRALVRALSAYDRTLRQESASLSAQDAVSEATAHADALAASHTPAPSLPALPGQDWHAPLQAAITAGQLGDMTMEEAVELVHLRGVVLDAVRILNIDAHAAKELNATADLFKSGDTGLRLVLASVPGPVRDKLHSLGILTAIGPQHVHQTVGAAVSALVGQAEYAAWTASLASYGQLLDVLLPHHHVTLARSTRVGEPGGDIELAPAPAPLEGGPSPSALQARAATTLAAME